MSIGSVLVHAEADLQALDGRNHSLHFRLMTQEFIPKYKWRVTWPDLNDADSHKTDFRGWDGETPVGRIRFESHGPKKNTWMWSGHGGKVRERLMPHQGYEPTARQAAAKAEDYCDRLMAHNGT